jgi:hypothetical protein
MHDNAAGVLHEAGNAASRYESRRH